MLSRRNLARLLAALTVIAVALPIAAAVTHLVGLLLAAMNDEVGANVVNRVNLAIVVAWLVDLALLLVVMAIAGLLPPDDAAK